MSQQYRETLQGKKIAIVVATPLTACVFLADQIKRLSKTNQVTLVADFSANPEFRDHFQDVAIEDIAIQREISLFADGRALFSLMRFFRSARPDLVHSVSPKAGLLAMLASYLTRVPLRIHTFTGQVWATKQGAARWLLKQLDKVIAFCASHILIDSPSQQTFLLNEKVVTAKQSTVLAQGSISGVDINRFIPDPAARTSVRNEHAIPEDAKVVLFLGRLKRDKGVLELIRAFTELGDAQDTFLFIIGPDEEHLTGQLEGIAKAKIAQIRFVPYTDEPQRYLASADLFCLPSYREGFGSVVIEAAACGVPAVATNIYGLSDAVEDGVTGLLVPVQNVDALCEGVRRLLNDPQLLKTMGENARSRAHQIFSQEHITDCLIDFYLALIEKESSYEKSL